MFTCVTEHDGEEQIEISTDNLSVELNGGYEMWRHPMPLVPVIFVDTSEDEVPILGYVNQQHACMGCMGGVGDHWRWNDLIFVPSKSLVLLPLFPPLLPQPLNPAIRATVRLSGCEWLLKMAPSTCEAPSSPCDWLAVFAVRWQFGRYYYFFPFFLRHSALILAQNAARKSQRPLFCTDNRHNGQCHSPPTVSPSVACLSPRCRCNPFTVPFRNIYTEHRSTIFSFFFSVHLSLLRPSQHSPEPILNFDKLHSSPFTHSSNTPPSTHPLLPSFLFLDQLQQNSIITHTQTT